MSPLCCDNDTPKILSQHKPSCCWQSCWQSLNNHAPASYTNGREWGYFTSVKRKGSHSIQTEASPTQPTIVPLPAGQLNVGQWKWNYLKCCLPTLWSQKPHKNLSIPCPLTATEVSVCLPTLFSQFVLGLTFWQSKKKPIFFPDEGRNWTPQQLFVMGSASEPQTWIYHKQHGHASENERSSTSRGFLLNSHLSCHCNANLSYCQEQKGMRSVTRFASRWSTWCKSLLEINTRLTELWVWLIKNNDSV